MWIDLDESDRVLVRLFIVSLERLQPSTNHHEEVQDVE